MPSGLSDSSGAAISFHEIAAHRRPSRLPSGVAFGGGSSRTQYTHYTHTHIGCLLTSHCMLMLLAEFWGWLVGSSENLTAGALTLCCATAGSIDVSAKRVLFGRFGPKGPQLRLIVVFLHSRKIAYQHVSRPDRYVGVILCNDGVVYTAFACRFGETACPS